MQYPQEEQLMLIKDRRISFAPGLLAEVRSIKCATIRRFDPNTYDGYFDYKAGDRVPALFRELDGNYWELLEITQDTSHKLFAEINDIEAQASGFDSARAVVPNMPWYEGLAPSDQAAIIWFRFVPQWERTNRETALLQELSTKE